MSKRRIKTSEQKERERAERKRAAQVDKAQRIGYLEKRREHYEAQRRATAIAREAEKIAAEARASDAATEETP